MDVQAIQTPMPTEVRVMVVKPLPPPEEPARMIAWAKIEGECIPVTAVTHLYADAPSVDGWRRSEPTGVMVLGLLVRRETSYGRVTVERPEVSWRGGITVEEDEALF